MSSSFSGMAPGRAEHRHGNPNETPCLYPAFPPSRPVRSLRNPVSSTQAIIAIMEKKRTEVMEHQEAGYFIHDWQELRNQVSRMIVSDPRYKAFTSQQG
jgi:hypothetical protein